ncbi:hypothetical protein SD37_26325 [Amycolatopsis orientalis]|uniref:Polymerase nucleotidyl transferase domain-containing protein n=1 Tax=Amycolatopsis orientalis TaxID=31958 RepID=A0A193C334_AMYOR|nr:hypothetical protein [Amycolatopsis orientalis]ANN18790.1 hypothetical protein SD37_26325 [Amycolatopsis orientalis]
MFTTVERGRVRDKLVAAAKADPRIAAAGFAGSSAYGEEDEWSDIDLALGLAPSVDYDDVVAAWTESLYREHGAGTHLDVRAGSTLFRVFLLQGTLQVDIAFWRAEEFGATGPRFEVLFGKANDVEKTQPPVAANLIGWAWLYALHARSSIGRGRVWQAEYMISGMRDQVFALACLRHDVPAVQGRGMDDVPPDAAAPLMAALVRSRPREW